MIPDRIAKIIASFFFIGHIRWAPGTFGSLAGLLIFWLLPEKGHLPVFLLASAAAFVACPGAVRAYAAKDPPPFVADEVCGMMLALLWFPKKIFLYFAAFILFRLLDTLKPWPIFLIQKKGKASCIVWDDLLAGALTNVVLRAGLALEASGLLARISS